MGLSKIAPEDFPDETECALGQWYYAGQGKPRYAGQSLYRRIEAPHQALHHEARRVSCHPFRRPRRLKFRLNLLVQHDGELGLFPLSLVAIRSPLRYAAGTD